MNHLYKEEQLFWAPPANYSASARWNFYMTRFLNLNATIFGNPYFVEQHPGPEWPPNDLQMPKLFRQSFSSIWQCITIELSSTIALQHNNATDMVWLPYSVPKQTSFTSCCPRPQNRITHYFLTILQGRQIFFQSNYLLWRLYSKRIKTQLILKGELNILKWPNNLDHKNLNSSWTSKWNLCSRASPYLGWSWQLRWQLKYIHCHPPVHSQLQRIDFIFPDYRIGNTNYRYANVLRQDKRQKGLQWDGKHNDSIPCWLLFLWFFPGVFQDVTIFVKLIWVKLSLSFREPWNVIEILINCQ